MVELQSGIEKINAADIHVVGVSYDSVDVLAKFTEKRKITFPLLSDPDSKVIKAYGVLNAEAKDQRAGIAHPGTFLIDRQGIIRAIIPSTVRKRHTVEDLLKAAEDKLPG
ncbi:MAG: peroxiredoxin family protein [Planctomycetota bacterium]|nr:peroxiredoxin family protein [Planctomycetota bacterium]